MTPNPSSSLTPLPGVPPSADPVEILAYSLWNDGNKDEAIAVLERQIALEKKLARRGLARSSASGGLAEIAGPALPVIFPKPPQPESWSGAAPTEKPIRSAGLPARIAQQAATHETEGAAPPVAPIRNPIAWPALPWPPTAWPRPSKRLALISGLSLLLLGGAGLWAGAERGETEVAQPAATGLGTAEPQTAQPGTAEVTGSVVPDEIREDSVAIDPAAPVAAPATLRTAEPAMPALEAPAAAAIDPPAPRLPRSRSEPPAIAQGGDTAADAPGAPSARPADQSPAAANASPQRPAADGRSERASRLAERREAAERYVARRRAEAERRAAARRNGATLRGPADDGPTILLGGRGLP